MQRVVLISKGKGDPITPPAYRRLSTLNTARQLLETMLLSTLGYIQDDEGFSNRLDGFRREYSIISAVSKILDTFHSAQLVNHIPSLLCY